MLRGELLEVSAKPLLAVMVCCLFGAWLWKYAADRWNDRCFATQSGCKPAPKWAARWPQGLDLLVAVFRHAEAGTILQFFLDVLELSGPTHEQRLLGSSGINTIEPQNIEHILSNQFDDFDLGLRPIHFAPLLGSGIFTQDGPAWKHSRALLRPQFASNRTQNFEEIKKCVENLLQQVPADGSIDLLPLFFRLTFDTTTFLLFGKTTSSLASHKVAGEESQFAKAFNIAQRYLSHRGRLGLFYWVANTPDFRKACKTSHNFVDTEVQKALDAFEEGKTAPGRQYVFVDALVRETQDKKALRDQCLNVLLAGRDTTACCLVWTTRLLAQHQHVLTKLRAEVEAVVGIGLESPQPTREQFKKMRYLDLVLKEVLRLYPSVPINSRAAVRTTTLPLGGGPDGKASVLVRKGQAVGYCVYAMHRRKDLYGEDAMQFVPERWEDGQLSKRIGYGYLPFNGGPRVCLGQDFALLEAGYTIVRMIQRFPYIELSEKEKTVEVGREKQDLTLVVAPANGCHVYLRSSP
ncbi:hypothetical protein OPT61_g2020 [Boeremia exigua]|uniref:Uncharacterized protein n=1 Tax=Boeremia exigua TaxID=749465 RepID=A0ACC2INE9_9PLEO|nr:hypothetical protein OPT61_g2020 [Boeremia exigua]